MAKVRVVIPVFNRKYAIRAALESVQAQTFQDLEIVVGDDGSSDGTPDIVTECARCDSRIKLLHLAHGGVGAARNGAIREPGDFQYVAFLDSDDTWGARHIERALDGLSVGETYDVYFGNFDVEDVAKMWSLERLEAYRERNASPSAIADSQIGEHFFELKAKTLRNALLRSYFCPKPSTVVVRRNAVLRSPWFREDLKIMEDSELFLYLAIRGCNYVFDEQVHVKMRRYGDNLSGFTDVFSARAAERFECELQYRREKFEVCETAEETKFVTNEVYDGLYFLAQNYAARLDLRNSRRFYRQCLALRRSYPAVKGLLLSTLPLPIYKGLRKLRGDARDAA